MVTINLQASRVEELKGICNYCKETENTWLSPYSPSGSLCQFSLPKQKWYSEYWEALSHGDELKLSDTVMKISIIELS